MEEGAVAAAGGGAGAQQLEVVGVGGGGGVRVDAGGVGGEAELVLELAFLCCVSGPFLHELRIRTVPS